MLPISLEFQGINSYQKKQYIDFSLFFNSKIFGIFGPTGAGKSTILDAVTYCLYGVIDRLGEKKIKESINPVNNKINVNFKFICNDKLYEIDRETGEKGSKVKLYSFDANDKKIPEAEKDKEVQKIVEKIIGLNYKDFSRVIALPQGKFSQFLKATPKEKSELLGKMFSLEHLDVKDNISLYIERKKGEYNSKSETLIPLKELSQDDLENLKIKLNEVELNINNNKSRKDIIFENYKKLLDLQKQFQNKKDINNKLDKWRQQENEIKKLIARIENSRKLEGINLLWNEYKQTVKELPKLEKEFDKLKTQLNTIEKILNDTTKEHEQFIQEYNHINIKIVNKENDIVRVKNINKKLESIKSDTNINEKKLKKLKIEKEILLEKHENLKVKKDSLEKEIESQRKFYSECCLSENEKKIFKKLIENLNLLEKINLFEDEINKLNVKKNNLIQKLDNIKQQIHNYAKDNNLEIESWNPDEIENFFEHEIDKTEKILSEFDLKIKELEILTNASIIAQNLKKGFPCPVCGSTKHPEPAKDLDSCQKIKKLEQEKLMNLSRRDKLKNFIIKTRVEISNWKQITIEIKNINEEIDERKNIKEINEKNFEKFINLKDKEPITYKNELEQRELKEKSIKDNINEINNKNSQIKIELIENQREIDKLGFSIKELERLIELLKTNEQDCLNEINLMLDGKKIDEIEEEIKLKRDEINSKEKILKKTLYDNRILRDSILNEKIVKEQDLKNKLNRKIELESIFEKTSIETNINLEHFDKYIISNQERNDIENTINYFEKTGNILKGQLKEIEERILKLPWNQLPEDEPEKTKLTLEGIENEISFFEQQKGKTINEIKNIDEKLKQKDMTEKQLKELEKDIDIYSELESVFRGNSLVKFASRYYLFQIVDEANIILKNICGDRFKIFIDEKELDFDIYDLILNSKRGINTLSGGEIFIVSFAFSLALSNYIQKTKNKKIDFFFLDEGFGNLDEELLDGITKVLEGLRNENVLVGLITHLEKLQEIIPNRVIVEKTLEYGSIIKTFSKNYY